MTRPDLSQLVVEAFSAALDDDLWRSWTQNMIRSFDGQGGMFWVIDSDRADMCRNYCLFRDMDPQALAAEYLDGPVEIDPQMTRVCTAKRSEIYLDTDHVDPDDLATREYLAWQVDRCGTRHHMTASVVVRKGLEAGISLHRSPAAGTFGARDKAALQKLFPSISQALKLGFRYHEALQESWWNGVCALSKGALVLVDERERVVRFTPEAEEIFRRGDGLQIKQGRLSAVESRNQKDLERAVGNAVRTVGAGADAVRIDRNFGGPDYLITTYPLARQHRYLAPFEAAALIHIADPERVLLPARTLQRQLHGFTEQEANIAALLLEGHSPRSMSELLSISTSTVKVHLQAVFRKTGTHKQSELVRLLLSTPR